MTGLVERYAVFGNPVSHSMSPAIHTLFAEQTGENITYDAQLVALDNFDNAVRSFCSGGGRGISVTIPFKQAAFELSGRLSPRAERAGAVNTMVLHAVDDYYGDNTDGIGLARDLIRNQQVLLSGKSILILGAGGAVRGVLEPLLGNKPKHITIANRTVDKALEIADIFSELGSITGCGYNDLMHQRYDIVINATSASLQGEMPTLPRGLVSADSFCYDMMYGREPTVFMRWAQDNGVRQTSDGLGMLVEQAAEAFSIWRGVAPKTAAVIASVRGML